MLDGKNILFIISGGIAAYKSLSLIRLIRKNGGSVRCILTAGGQHFVTPMSVSALCEHPAYTDLWSLKDESEMGHIRLSRAADLIVVAPASANIIAQMAHGLAPDLATTTLLAADTPVIIAPAMNHKMWDHPATQKNIDTLIRRAVCIIPPTEGEMACGEHGTGRMAEPEDIFEHINAFFLTNRKGPDLKGITALVTAGPTHEPIDPVRFIGNRSSGKQGYAIAQTLANCGAHVKLVSGPVSITPPQNVEIIAVQTAQDMYKACIDVLKQKPDIAICTAAVADWTVQRSDRKIKKRGNHTPPALDLKENPDILHMIATHDNRPNLVVGMAAETENIIKNAQDKRARKNCDWILANDVSHNAVFGQDKTHIYFVTKHGIDDWGSIYKHTVAEKLVALISEFFESTDKS
jgi:phosphopantothenoylcysteine decarboxylase/phosphopantothenate--cysteine ligase